MNNRKIVFILNPVAGNGKTVEVLPEIKKYLSKTNEIEYKIIISKYKGNITEVTKEFIDNGYSEIIGIGGDGTLSEIINGINFEKENDIRVGIIPHGTGNDLVRNFDLLYDIKSVLNRILRSEYKIIDIGKVNEHYFINNCSFGIDGPIVLNTEKLKKIISGKYAYLLSTLKIGMVFKSNFVKVKIDENEINKKMMLITVCNGSYFGGGMNICPEAMLDDGVFNLCIVDDVKKTTFIRELSKIYKGKLDEVKAVNYYEFKKMEIEINNNYYLINADGNIVGRTPAKIEILKNAIKIY